MPDDSFDCQATAAVLRCGNSVALAGHVAMIIGMLAGMPNIWVKGSSALVWCAIVYLSVRVHLDARLFELLATHSPEQLDDWLEVAGLREKRSPRTIQDRRRGALRLWRALVAAVGIEIGLMLIGMFRVLA
jgi:hypothetical protein